MEALLEVGPLGFSTAGKKLFEGVFLHLYPGDFVHLKGPSGSGKTTLLRQVVGLEPSGARRFLKGKPYTLGEMARFRTHCLYLAPEAPAFEGTVEENLLFPFRFRNNQGKVARDPQGLLKRLGLKISLKSPAVSLSTGERQRLALARALLFDPDIILADEPFSALDEENFKRAFELLYTFAQRAGKAVLCVSHGELPRRTRALLLARGELKELP